MQRFQHSPAYAALVQARENLIRDVGPAEAASALEAEASFCWRTSREREEGLRPIREAVGRVVGRMVVQ